MEEKKETQNTYNPLLLKHQLCFPLYASARKIVAAYHPFLKSIGLTYPQYVTMMVLWEYKEITMYDLGQKLYLDSGTLTPVLKKLESQGYITRRRHPENERLVLITITPKGEVLRHNAESIPCQMSRRINRKGNLFTEDELKNLKENLQRIIDILDTE